MVRLAAPSFSWARDVLQPPYRAQYPLVEVVEAVEVVEEEEVEEGEEEVEEEEEEDVPPPLSFSPAGIFHTATYSLSLPMMTCCPSSLNVALI
jgi:hypothetical protein